MNSNETDMEAQVSLSRTALAPSRLSLQTVCQQSTDPSTRDGRD